MRKIDKRMVLASTQRGRSLSAIRLAMCLGPNGPQMTTRYPMSRSARAQPRIMRCSNVIVPLHLRSTRYYASSPRMAAPLGAHASQCAIAQGPVRGSSRRRMKLEHAENRLHVSVHRELRNGLEPYDVALWVRTAVVSRLHFSSISSVCWC